MTKTRAYLRPKQRVQLAKQLDLFWAEKFAAKFAYTTTLIQGSRRAGRVRIFRRAPHRRCDEKELLKCHTHTHTHITSNIAFIQSARGSAQFNSRMLPSSAKLRAETIACAPLIVHFLTQFIRCTAWNNEQEAALN
jgi:hypothetical protein